MLHTHTHTHTVLFLCIECDMCHIQFFVHMWCDQLLSKLITLWCYYLHTPTAYLSCFQESVYYAGIKIFGNLPSDLKSLMNEKAWVQTALKLYLNTHLFYSSIKNCVNSICCQYLCVRVCDHCFLGFSCLKTSVVLCICFVFIWHTSHPTIILTNFGSRECNAL
jgi:hypothetical protein